MPEDTICATRLGVSARSPIASVLTRTDIEVRPGAPWAGVSQLQSGESSMSVLKADADEIPLDTASNVVSLQSILEQGSQNQP